MRKTNTFCVALSGILIATQLFGDEYISGKKWSEPPVVDVSSGGAPSDAIVLFNGKDMSAWHNGEKWKIKDGVATTHGGGVISKQSFGDCQLHVEWAAPEKVQGSGQDRGNSGVYLMGKYEVQILDSYDNVTYFDGQAASIYKQHPPLVNVSRKPGEWQTYDIIFSAPCFDVSGKLEKPAYVTVLHNGVLVQNHFEIEGTSDWDSPPRYETHSAKLPLQLQDHGSSVRFRSIWIRAL